jgi:hypothetical protein
MNGNSKLRFWIVILFLVIMMPLSLKAENEDRDFSFKRFELLFIKALKDRDVDLYFLSFPPEFNGALIKNRAVIESHLRDAIVPEGSKGLMAVSVGEAEQIIGKSRMSAAFKNVKNLDDVKCYKITWVLKGGGSVEDVIILRNGLFYKIANL